MRVLTEFLVNVFFKVACIEKVKSRKGRPSRTRIKMEEAQLKSDNPKKAMIEKDDSLPIQNNIVDVKLDEQQVCL